MYLFFAQTWGRSLSCPSMDIDAEKLRRLRQHQGLSIRELSQKSGISPGAIWKIEAGQRKWAQGRTLRKLAAALEVDPSELLEDA